MQWKPTFYLLAGRFLLVDAFLPRSGGGRVNCKAMERFPSKPSSRVQILTYECATPKSALSLSTIPLPYHSWWKNSIQIVNNSVARAIHSVKTNEGSRWRAAIFTFFSSLVVFRHGIDASLATLWTYLMTSSALPARIFRTDSYEWVLAVTAFFVYIHFFSWADRAVRKAAAKGKAHPWRKYRLQDRFEADKLRRRHQMNMLLQQSTTGVDESSSLDAALKTDQDAASIITKHTTWNWKGYIFELWVYVIPLLTWDILSPRRHRRLGAFDAPHILPVCRDIAGGLLLYDFFFFTGHVLMHKIPMLYRTIHKKHHEVPEVRAGDVVRLSAVEEVLEVGFSIIALNLLGAHPIARSIYNCSIVFLLTELHCGFDFPWTPQNVVPFGLATGSRRHHYHHRFNRHYYQKFFFTFDRLFGFFQKDDGSLQGDSVKADTYIPPLWKGA